MLLRKISLIAFCFYTLACSAQKEIIAHGIDLISANKYAEASRYFDSILKRNPKNIDAWMMKGNVLLNYTWQNTGSHYFDVEKAESIFDSTNTLQAFAVTVIPDDTSRMVEKYWLKCLKLDSNRLDIKMGLCNLYSISLRIEDLRAMLKQTRQFTIDSNNAFKLAEYARNIKISGHFEDAMSVYQTIANLFPNLAGIRADMAGEYFYEGRGKDALRYLDSALTRREIDATTYINSAAIYSMLGYYQNAYETFDRFSKQEHSLMKEFYEALVRFGNLDTTSYIAFQSFLNKANINNYNDEVYLAQKIAALGSGFTIDQYKALAADDAIPNYYKVLIHLRGMQQFKGNCEPMLLYGIFHASIKNYLTATQFLDEGEQCKMKSEQTEYWMLTYGYCLYQIGEQQKAMNYFIPLLNSQNTFYQQAAKYFYGKCLLTEKSRKEAIQQFDELAASPVKTKYALLARRVIIPR